MSVSSRDLTVVKVGGSLYDLPDLGTRLRGWLATLPSPRVLLVPGGGPTANVVRDLDRRHRLGESTAHDLALRSLTLNAAFLSALLCADASRGGSAEVFPVVNPLGRPGALWGRVCILEPHAFCEADAPNHGSLPACWDTTSDSIAARAAVFLRAGELILLKSVTLPDPCDWAEAGRRGWVDPLFAAAVAGTPLLRIRAFNLRTAAAAAGAADTPTHPNSSRTP
jgi:aspartokinase-like uncharacterized kinase